MGAPFAYSMMYLEMLTVVAPLHVMVTLKHPNKFAVLTIQKWIAHWRRKNLKNIEE